MPPPSGKEPRGCRLYTQLPLCPDKCALDGQVWRCPQGGPREAAARAWCCPAGRGGPCGGGPQDRAGSPSTHGGLLAGHPQLVFLGCSSSHPSPPVGFNFQAKVAKEPFMSSQKSWAGRRPYPGQLKGRLPGDPASRGFSFWVLGVFPSPLTTGWSEGATRQRSGKRGPQPQGASTALLAVPTEGPSGLGGGAKPGGGSQEGCSWARLSRVLCSVTRGAGSRVRQQGLKKHHGSQLLIATLLLPLSAFLPSTR